MAIRIAGVDLNENWKLDYALTRIKGVGWATSQDLLKGLKIKLKKKVADLSRDEVGSIAAKIDGIATEGDLVSRVRSDITRLKQAGTYRGVRHSRGLPARGQRTRRNARTKRGKRKTVGAFRKEALTKMQQGQKSEGKE